MKLLKNKRILLVVSGGIAAYKSAELIRMLMKEGADVRVAMTKNATKFVGEITFQALTNHPVLTDMFSNEEETGFGHIAAARWPDCIVVAPATANLVAKVANGIADDMVSTLLVATRKRVVFAPAMNWAMWANEIVQNNIDRLMRVKRFSLVKPEAGDLACGEEGAGRLAKLEWIRDAAVYATREEKDLSSELVVVTAGPTYEDIDPVRYVANRSSGKMGYSIAREAKARGARVLLVSGPSDEQRPLGVNLVSVRSAKEMLDAVMRVYSEARVIIKAAAVADYRPQRVASQKIHKSDVDFNLAMTKTDDILSELGKNKKPHQFLVGFAAETNQVMQNAKKKLNDKKLDMIVVNDVSSEGAGFEVDTNVVKIIDKAGRIESLPMLDKSEVAAILFDMVQKHRGERERRNNNRQHSQRSQRSSRVGKAPEPLDSESSNNTSSSNKQNSNTSEKKTTPSKSTQKRQTKTASKTTKKTGTRSTKKAPAKKTTAKKTSGQTKKPPQDIEEKTDKKNNEDNSKEK